MERGFDPRTLGVFQREGGLLFRTAAKGKMISLLLFRRNEEAAFFTAEFPEMGRIGKVRELFLPYHNVFPSETFEGDLDALLRETEYCYRNERSLIPDPCGLSFSGRDSFGKREQYGNPLRSPLLLKPFDWGGDKKPDIPFSDSIIYRLNVRGFTKSPSSGVVQKGTFEGIREKIPYLKELGITAVELMPCQEYEEIMMPERAPLPEYLPSAVFEKLTEELKEKQKEKSAEARVNLWGYTEAYRFAPKASFCTKKNRDPAGELRQLVKALHEAGIEIIFEFYFAGKQTTGEILEILRWYTAFYHADGFRLTGEVDLKAIAGDPFLADVKLIAEYWPEEACRADAAPEKRRLGNANTGYQNDMRRVVRGDQGVVGAAAYRLSECPRHTAPVNFLASNNGLTLFDTVCYKKKYNEANGEENTDGPEENMSSGYGAEGPSRKKEVNELRLQQLKNFFLLLFLSRGTPLLYAGDEFGRTQEGNNNAWCQDNETGWVDWKKRKKNEELFTFVQRLIRFRREHGILRGKWEASLIDPKGSGLPELSWHGTIPGKPEYAEPHRQLGMLLSGAYGKKPDGSPDDTIYFMMNPHWEEKRFLLPKPGKDKVWQLYVCTGTPAYAQLPEDNAGETPDRTVAADIFDLPAYSMAVFIAKEQ